MFPAPVIPLRQRSARTAAFTLIELILVMALLVIVIGIVTPKLLQFFAGRALDSEARRFVALTHYGQARAVSEGVPMLLWINPKLGSYGLQEQSGYTDGDRKSIQYQVDKDLAINVAKGTITVGGSGALQAVKRGSLPGIYFSPDGMVMRSMSVPTVSIQQDRQHIVWIVPSANRIGYEALSQNATTANLRR